MDDARQGSLQTQPPDLNRFYKDVPVGLCSLDLDLRYIHINEWLAAINGIPVQEHLGRTIGDVLPDVAAVVEPLLRQVIETGEPIHDGIVEVETPARPRIKRILQHNYMPVKSDDDTIIGVTCVVQDITARQQDQKALRESEERYRRLAELMPIAMYTCDVEGRITYFNEQAVTCWGRKPKIGDRDDRFCGSLRLYRPDGSFLPHDKTPMAISLKEGCSFRDQEVTIERPGGAARIHSANSSGGLISTSGSGSNWDSSKGGSSGSAAPKSVRCVRAASRPR